MTMLYNIRPMSVASTIRRVFKTNTIAKQIGCIASNRTYGTTVSKVRAPKAATASKATQTTTVKKTTVKKAAAKKPAAKKVAAKKKVVKKPKKKVVPKKKPAAKKKGPSKTTLEKERREKTKQLKEIALLDEPTKAIASPWHVYLEEVRSSGNFEGSDAVGIARGANATKEAGKRWKSLPAAELERITQQAQEKKRVKEIEYKKWVSAHTPKQILEANRARAVLQNALNEKRTKGTKRKYLPIEDDRLVKLSKSAYMQYSADKWASGAFEGKPIPEAAKLLGAEWAALSPAERKPYEERAAADKLKATQEKQTVYQ